MKLKKGIGELLCCAAVIGMFSLGGLHTKAALCDHTYLQMRPDIYKGFTYDSAGHYDVYGDEGSCPRCGYIRWENVYKVWKSSHRFEQIGTDAYGKPIYSNQCSACEYIR